MEKTSKANDVTTTLDESRAGTFTHGRVLEILDVIGGWAWTTHPVAGGYRISVLADGSRIWVL